MPQSAIPPAQTWDKFVGRQPRAHVLQLSEWGALKSAFEWTSETAIIGGASSIEGGALLLFKPLPYRLGTMAYLPMGPYASSVNQAAVWTGIHYTARSNGAAFLKWEPGIYEAPDVAPDFAALGFRPSPQTVQPPTTVLIDLSGDDETILARMNQGTRRKIRQSQKSGIIYKQAKRNGMDKFAALMRVTGERDSFGVHEASYYARAYDLFVPNYAALILAEHQGDLLAGVMVFAVGKTAWYLYGASSNIKRNLMASYGVQWEALQWAKRRGCKTYDMWGVPDADEATLEAQFEQRSDGLWGVYGFKRGWGGRVARSAGAWDYVYNPLVYAAYKLAVRYRG